MTALRHFPWPVGRQWVVAYFVPGTVCLRLVCTCRRFECAAAEARRLNTTVQAPARPRSNP